MKSTTDPLLPFCPFCRAQHRPATNGKGETVWCGGVPTWETRIARARTSGSFTAEDRERARDWARCAVWETTGVDISRALPHTPAHWGLSFGVQFSRAVLELNDPDAARAILEKIRLIHAEKVRGTAQ